MDGAGNRFAFPGRRARATSRVWGRPGGYSSLPKYAEGAVWAKRSGSGSARPRRVTKQGGGARGDDDDGGRRATGD